MDNKPAIQTSATVEPIDISFTENITHVYVKVEEPRGLCPRFEGPYRVISRPSRSQVQVRVGSFADGSPRLLTYHRSSCKPAHMRDGALEGSRPNIGRRPNPTVVKTSLMGNKQPSESTNSEPASPDDHATSTTSSPHLLSTPAERGKFETRNTRPVRSTRNANPSYVDAIKW